MDEKRLWLLRLYGSILRELPLAGGLTRLSFNPAVNALCRGSESLVETTMWPGLPIDVDLRDYHGRTLFLFGTNDPKVAAVVRALLQPGDAFLDIGANHGSIGIAAADAVGREGVIHLFEPQAGLAARVERALARSPIRNVRLHRVALLDRNGTMVLQKPQTHSGMATLVAHGDQSTWEREEISVVDIAEYAPPLVAGRPFGVKLDIEGAERFLMPWLIAQPNLRFLVFEGSNWNRASLWDIVTPAGFATFGLERRVYAKTVRRIDRVEDMEGHHDFLALPRASVAGLPRRLDLAALRRIAVAGRATVLQTRAHEGGVEA
jgi:FkbM family methyltransferase